LGVNGIPVSLDEDCDDFAEAAGQQRLKKHTSLHLLPSLNRCRTHAGRDNGVPQGMVSQLIAVVFFISAPLPAALSPFDESLELQHRGKLKEARHVLLLAASAFRASSNEADLAKVLSLAGQLSLSLGDYRAAIDEALQSAAVRKKLPPDRRMAEDFNTLGLAYVGLGEYGAALLNYQRALDIDRQYFSAEGEITRRNNMGNVYYFQGRYMDALRSYQAALEKVNATASEKWNPRRRQLTLANLATLYQRLGKDETALTLYRQMAGATDTLISEQAQFLLNEGVLYRRLGDPIKALQLYRESQSLFAADHHPDGEIGAWRNIGIARAVDLNDLSGALQAFTQAAQLALQSSSRRGIAQANLYRAEVLRRLGNLSEAGSTARAALDAAQESGLVEERWKAAYALGKVAEDRGDDAVAFYEKAIAGIESIRSGLALVSLRTEFLADKRDVYDSIIALKLHRDPGDVNRVFSWIERSRSRTLVERVVAPSGPAPGPTIAAIQSHLPADAVLLDLWVGSDDSATLWITRSAAGVVPHAVTARELGEAASRMVESAQNRNEEWKTVSRDLGGQLLFGVPLAAHIIVVPDGPLSAVPFEALTEPATGSLLVEKHDVSYLPAAQFLLSVRRSGKWMFPWQRQLIAFGDPSTSAEVLDGPAEVSPLPASAGEVTGIAALLPGRSELYLGPKARKRELMNNAAAGVPLVHFSTHAIVDEENPDRSRILMAPVITGSADYLFEGEVYNLNLHGVDLATLSACDTARGKLIRGEGVEAFSRAFLAAGASATVTSLWRVADESTADFMKQFYYFLARGQSKAVALRSAKLKFLHSNSGLAGPRYWAAFILSGDGWNPTRRVIPWSAILGVLLLVFALAGIFVRRALQTPTVAPAPQRKE
jgi:tetratricopeptide (TPR) repeat protein